MHFPFQGQIVTVFGGTGFLGRAIVAELVQAGARVKIVTRHKNSAYFLRVGGNPGQVEAISCAFKNLAEIETIVSGSSVVINCLGILFEKGRFSSFSTVHKDYALWITKACAKHKIRRFIHISALGVDKAVSKYALSKFAGEQAILSSFPRATILRPSVIFGPEDNFFNMFARIAKISPFLPLIGGGKTLFQPVYVGDVAKACVLALNDPHTTGHIYELGGPEILSFKQIMSRMLSYTHQHRLLLPIPWWIARIQALVLGIFPKPLLTNDQVTSLQTDNIVDPDQKNFSHLGLAPTPLDAILPLYLSHPQRLTR